MGRRGPLGAVAAGYADALTRGAGRVEVALGILMSRPGPDPVLQPEG